MQQDATDWTQLVIDCAAVPSPVDEGRYRQWLGAQRVFVSSVMDDELRSYREAVRTYLKKHGGQAVMWETVTPQDQPPEQAYLEGVRQSTLFLLMLGQRYGVADASGYSPTHKEANEAEQQRLPRLLFTLPATDRDGRLNDWLRSLYSVISGIEVKSPDHLVERLDDELRKLAARSQRSWIKLGRFVFPGKVSRTTDQQRGEQFVVTARVASNEVRQGLLGMGGPFHQEQMRLTWPDHSFVVRVEAVASESEYVNEDAVTLTCRGVEDRGGEMAMNLNGVGPTEQAELWARRAILGEACTNQGPADLIDLYTRPDGPTLPQILKSAVLSGWQAEGVARLYAVEELQRKWGGTFDSIEVGPATASGVPIRATARLPRMASNVPAERFEVQGVLPLAAAPPGW